MNQILPEVASLRSYPIVPQDVYDSALATVIGRGTDSDWRSVRGYLAVDLPIAELAQQVLFLAIRYGVGRVCRG